MSLRAEGISFAYRPGERVLDRVSVAVETGKVAFVLGANGAGKTTLLSCLSGIIIPDSGKVTIAGEPISHLSPRDRARRIGFVPQLHAPVFAYTVWEMVLMGRAPHMRFFSRPTRSDRAAAARALRAIGLWEQRDRPYTEISGGERRLALIARGLAQGVNYLLMDEPDAHLDPAFQHRILTLLGALADSEGLGIMSSSHHPNNALAYADRAIVLGAGRVLAAGPPRETVAPHVLNAAYSTEFDSIERDGHCVVLPVVRAPRGETGDHSTPGRT